MWESHVGCNVDTAQVMILDPLVAVVDSTSGSVYILKEVQSEGSDEVTLQLVIVPTEGTVRELKLPSSFHLQNCRRYPGLAKSGHLLVLGPEKLFIIDVTSGAVRECEGSWSYVFSDSEETVYLVNAEGCVQRAGVGITDSSFPGELSRVFDFQGPRLQFDRNVLLNDDWMREQLGDVHIPLRESSSVINGICASGNSCFLACKGHGLWCVSLPKADFATEIIEDKKSADGLAYPSALYSVGTAVFVQCPDGIRRTNVSGGTVSLVLAAADMVFEDDSGSPEPFPEEFIGVDAQYLYFLVQRDFYSGEALRRWPHGTALGRK